MFATLARISLFFGTFPYKYDAAKNELHFSYFGGTSSLVVLLLIAYMILDLFMRLAENNAGLNPQTFLLCFAYVNHIVIVVRRLWRRKYIQNLYSQLLQLLDRQSTLPYRREKWKLYSLLLVMVLEVIYIVGLSIVNVIILIEVLTRVQLLRIFLFTFCLTVTYMTPPTIEWQYTTQCIILRCSLARLNENLQHILRAKPILEDTLVVNRRQRSRVMRILKAVNGESGFEQLVLPYSMMMISIYLCNDILLLIRTDVKKTFWRSLSGHKLALNVLCLFFLFMRLYWLCEESEKLVTEVKKTEKIIMKHDIAGLPTNIFIQVEKYIYLLNQPQNSLALCGFFHLNMKFAFNVLGNVVAFVLIFIQLNGSDNWIF